MDKGIDLALLKKGDEEAFAALVRLCERKVYNLALRYTNNEADALDVSQEVFLRVFRALPGFKGDSSLTTWVYRIAVNTSIDLSRRRSRRAESSLTETDEEGRETELPDLRYSPEAEYGRTELREAIKAAIAALDSDYRAVIILRDVNGLSYGEISEALALSEGTVKSRIFRAREKLRVPLAPYGNFSSRDASKSVKGGEEDA